MITRTHRILLTIMCISALLAVALLVAAVMR